MAVFLAAEDQCTAMHRPTSIHSMDRVDEGGEEHLEIYRVYYLQNIILDDSRVATMLPISIYNHPGVDR